MRIYVAGPLAAFQQGRALSKALETRGYRVVSSWHDVVEEGMIDPTCPDARQLACNACLEEVDLADVVVAMVAMPNPRGTYVEIGYAIGKGKPVIWATDKHRTGCSVFDMAPGCMVTESDGEIFLALAGLSVM